MLPDQKGEKLMGKFRKYIKCDDIITGEDHYNSMQNKSLYEVEYPDRTMDKLAYNILAENMISQLDSEDLQYQVLTKVTNQKRDYRTITKVGGFIKSSNGNLNQNRTTLGWKLLV